MRYYTIYDLGTANAVGGFATEGEALDAVRQAVAAHGPRIVRPWSLAWEDDEGNIAEIARGAALRKLAEQAVASA